MTADCPRCEATFGSMDALADHLTDDHDVLAALAEVGEA